MENGNLPKITKCVTSLSIASNRLIIGPENLWMIIKNVKETFILLLIHNTISPKLGILILMKNEHKIVKIQIENLSKLYFTFSSSFKV